MSLSEFKLLVTMLFRDRLLVLLLLGTVEAGPCTLFRSLSGISV